MLFSDHRLILFNISITIINPKVFRYPRNDNCDKFAITFGSELQNNPLGTILINLELDNTVGLLETALRGAFNKSCPVSRKRKMERLPRWE